VDHIVGVDDSLVKRREASCAGVARAAAEVAHSIVKSITRASWPFARDRDKSRLVGRNDASVWQRSSGSSVVRWWVEDSWHPSRCESGRRARAGKCNESVRWLKRERR
jgi:hypothetical protein